MNYYIVVFNSRTSSFAFHDLLQKNNISSRIINTPSKAQVGCGICIRFSQNDIQRVRRMQEINREFYLASFFKVTQNGVGTVLVDRL